MKGSKKYNFYAVMKSEYVTPGKSGRYSNIIDKKAASKKPRRKSNRYERIKSVGDGHEQQ